MRPLKRTLRIRMCQLDPWARPAGNDLKKMTPLHKMRRCRLHFSPVFLIQVSSHGNRVGYHLA
jgi:hypothetical protein